MTSGQVIKVGITGGIGSGKTTIANLFKKLNYPVYIADTEASRLINQDDGIYRRLTDCFGKKIYTEKHILDKKKLSGIIFNDKNALRKVNSIVHPVVLDDFIRWSGRKKEKIVFLESAILFESGWEKQFDYTICVTASTSTKIERVVKRDCTTPEEVMRRMKNQQDDREKCSKANFIIDTDEGEWLLDQVLEIENKLIEIIKQ